MAEEIAEFDDQIQELISAMQMCLRNEVSKLSGNARLEKCDYLKNRHTRAKQVMRSFQVEMRELPAVHAGEYNEKYRKYDSELIQLQQDIQWATSAGEGEANAAGRRTVDDMNAKEITQEAMNVQNQSIAATARTKQVLQQTILIGTDTAVSIKGQTEVIARVNNNMDELESNLKRADKQLRVLLRKMATDKIFILFIFLIVAAIIAVLVVVFVKPKLEGKTTALGASPITFGGSSPTSPTSTAS